jgi:hypothetical protein
MLDDCLQTEYSSEHDNLGRGELGCMVVLDQWPSYTSQL